MRILKSEQFSRRLKTRDRVGQLEVQVEALEGLSQNTEGSMTCHAQWPPEGFDPNAVRHLARELGQVKSYFEGQIRTVGHNMDTLMARMQEEHLRPRGANPMRTFWGIFLGTLTGVRGRTKHPFMHPQLVRPDDFLYETHRSSGVSDHRVPTNDGMPPRGNQDPNADFRDCRVSLG